MSGKKLFICLDLDETLLHVVENNSHPSRTRRYYRPGLKEFFERCFQISTSVSIWSASGANRIQEEIERMRILEFLSDDMKFQVCLSELDCTLVKYEIRDFPYKNLSVLANKLNAGENDLLILVDDLCHHLQKNQEFNTLTEKHEIYIIEPFRPTSILYEKKNDVALKKCQEWIDSWNSNFMDLC